MASRIYFFRSEDGEVRYCRHGSIGSFSFHQQDIDNERIKKLNEYQGITPDMVDLARLCAAFTWEHYTERLKDGLENSNR